MKKVLKRDLRNKEHTKEIKAGTVVDVSFPQEYRGMVVRYTDSNGVSICGYSRLMFGTIDIKAPSYSTMEKWMSDSFCKSVNGKKVEPDGFDGDGYPSWLIVLGMI